MTSYSLNPNGMLDASAELSAVTSNIQQTIDDLNAAVAVYIEANSGETREAFQQAKATWSAGMANMQAALVNANRALDDIRDRYVAGDAKGASLFSG